MSDKLDNSAISKHLGQSSQYKSQYDASLLVREPRANNRKHLSIEENDLPFIGLDVWNGFEVSALTNNGLPTALIAKVMYSCDSKYIVESKSMKLYWNTFNMTKLGDTYDDVCKELEQIASEDLSELLETDVRVSVWDPISVQEPEYRSVVHDSNLYRNIDHVLTEEDGDVTQYSEDPNILIKSTCTPTNQALRVHSTLLKSNCRVTSQPDWGDVYIHIDGDNLPTVQSLLKYIISFRDECHFHEEICETMYKRLWDKFKPAELSVVCLYVRRGGWDINPQRCSHEFLIEESMHDEHKPWVKTGRQ